VLWAGWPFFVRGWLSLKNRSLNMFTLIALGVGVAYAFSVVALLFPEILPAAFRQEGRAPLYFEAAAVITALVLLGQVLELRARSRTSLAIKALLQLAPAYRAPGSGRRFRRRDPIGSSPRRRSPPRSARRQDPGRWRRRGRPFGRGRIDDDR